MNKTVAQRLAHQIRAQIDAASLTQTAIGDALHMSQSALSRRYLAYALSTITSRALPDVREQRTNRHLGR